MARRTVAGPSQDGPASIVLEAQPPPSTIAAQIVESHAQAAGQQRPQARATFSELLDEIRHNPNLLEPDVESNAKLVHVLAEAGLESPRSDDPFVSQDEVNHHILVSLEVIELAFLRNPGVLLYNEAQPDDGAASPMFVGLLPRILSLADSYRNKTLSEGVEALLSTFYMTLLRLPNFWKDGETIFRFYSACVDGASALMPNRRAIWLTLLDVLDHLEEVLSRFNPTLSLDAVVPSSDTRALFCNNPNQSIALAQSSQVRITHAVQALTYIASSINVLCRSLDAMLDTEIWPANQYCSLILDSLLRVWRCAPKIINLLKTPHERQQIAFYCLSILDKLSISSQGSMQDQRAANKMSLVLVESIASVADWPVDVLSESVQHMLALNLSNLSRWSPSDICQMFQAVGMTELTLDKLVQNSGQSQSLMPDLSTTCNILRDIVTNTTISNGPELTSSSVQERINSIDDRVIRERLTKPRKVGSQQPDGSKQPPLKRHKKSQSGVNGHNATAEYLLGDLCSILGNWKRDNLTSLPDNIENLYRDLGSGERTELWKAIGRLACCKSSSRASEQDGSRATHVVKPCNCETFTKNRATTMWDTEHWTLFHNILTRLLNSTNVQLSKEHKTISMSVVKQYAYHTTIPSYRDLTDSVLGKWCLQSLSSSFRELRVTAGQALPAFLTSDSASSEQSSAANRIIAMKFLRKMAEKDEARYAETAILALGQVSRVCGDDELNLILLQLVDYLGHSNPLVCSSAHLELQRLADESNISVEELLRPFWKTVAIAVVRDLPAKPQKVQHLADLLGMTVNRFLGMTQNDTVPYLVLWKNLDALQRIAHTRDQSSTIWSLCMQERNLVAILSLLIAHQSVDLEKDIKTHLVQVSSQFKNEDVSELLKLYPVAVACEILKLAGEEEGDINSKILDSFKEFTVLVERRGQQTKSSTMQARMTSSFFENQALGIVASLVDIIDSPIQHVVEKKRCLRGMDEMIRAAGSSISIALPQIRTCLQATLFVPELRDLAFSAWVSLLSVLDADEDLESLIDPTFTALVQHWDGLGAETQKKAYEAVGNLLKNHNTLIQGSVDSIPSLASIPLMSKFESQLSRLKAHMDTSQHLYAFSRRCEDENSSVVQQALRELLPFLEVAQTWIHESAATEQPNQAIAVILRSLLDVCVRYNEDSCEISDLAARCLGIVGCLDPSRIETVREKKDMIAHSNFEKAGETVEFVAVLLEDVLVKAFHSTSNLRAQGFLAYVMQELLKFCGFSKEATNPFRPHGTQGDETLQRWNQMPESVRTTLTPFLSSRYALKSGISGAATNASRPILLSLPSLRHGVWLREFVFDLLQKSKGDNARKLFTLLARIIRGYDVAIADFLLPYAAANIIIGGTTTEVEEVHTEMMAVLETPVLGKSEKEAESLRLCSQNIFQVLGYLSRWVQEMKKLVSLAKTQASRAGGRANAEFEEVNGTSQIDSVETFLSKIPAALIAQRAVECGAYARALLHWEEYIRQQRQLRASNTAACDEDTLFQQLQDIYSQIDEPDGIEGVLGQMSSLTPEQTILEHRKAGKWSAAQSWYELQLQEEPDNIRLQTDLLSCFQDAGQYNILLQQAKTLPRIGNSQILSMVCEASWVTERWDDLQKFLDLTPAGMHSQFNVGVGTLLTSRRDGVTHEEWNKKAADLRSIIVRSLSSSTTSSLQTCHDQLLKLHALYEIEHINGFTKSPHLVDNISASRLLRKRLDVLGAFISDKQYLLGIRRAAINCSNNDIFEQHNVAESWTTSARLARKNDSTNVAYDSVLRALRLGDASAKIEQARLLWKEGEHRKAIQSLERVIESNVLQQHPESFVSDSANHSLGTASVAASVATSVNDPKNAQSFVVARAYLLLAKWQDHAGQSSSDKINRQYQLATRTFQKWEKGLYYLGKFYNKILESQKALPLSKQATRYLTGETAKLVIENYLRSMVFGCKYLFETLPKILTIWLDFGVEISRTVSKEVPDDIRPHVMEQRPKMLDIINKQVKKYLDKIMPYLFYTALPQMITRISHPNQKVYDVLASAIIKVIVAHPQQALWSVLAVVKSSAPDRASRGVALLNKLKDRSKSIRNEGMSVDLKTLVTQGQRLSDGLLQACEVPIEGRQSHVSLSRDLHFNPKLAPCGLVIPLDKTLSVSLPTTSNDASANLIRHHKAFPMTREAITVSSFQDDVLVLSSLQKPRKITVLGTDGRKYGLLCKPNDDLRKDQRLMEFNAMINRSLKKDAPSSTRRLYIKTYAVTPLNEACGLIEWVDGLKPMRDILLHAYRAKNVRVDYNQLRGLLDEACNSSDPSIFTERILPSYPPLLHEWFTDLFPEPEAWFVARTRYTRSCAVASLVGHALGLGDRHGENVLLEESSGGVFHVDFNCLFDKGLTFEKPEMVPFRLTHNMVDAMGVCGVEGPFRASAEATLRVMRSNLGALLTILETFVYDPTADFVGRRKVVRGVPETPKEVLDGVRAKVEGFLRGESVPLGVEGYVDWVIGQAVDPANLAAMYIGWCAFL